jgi:hypothetical protein
MRRKKLAEEGFQICIKSSCNFTRSWKPDHTRHAQNWRDNTDSTSN